MKQTVAVMAIILALLLMVSGLSRFVNLKYLTAMRALDLIHSRNPPYFFFKNPLSNASCMANCLIPAENLTFTYLPFS